MKIPKVGARLGSTKPLKVFRSPMDLMVWKFDTMRTSVGIIIVAINIPKIKFLCLNSRNTKAKAAIKPNIICTAVIIPELIKEFMIYFPKGCSLKAFS